MRKVEVSLARIEIVDLPLRVEGPVAARKTQQFMPCIDDGIQNAAAIVDDGHREAVAPALRQPIPIGEIERIALFGHPLRPAF